MLRDISYLINRNKQEISYGEAEFLPTYVGKIPYIDESTALRPRVFFFHALFGKFPPLSSRVRGFVCFQVPAVGVLVPQLAQ
jgi:hypothetical protein